MLGGCRVYGNRSQLVGVLAHTRVVAVVGYEVHRLEESDYDVRPHDGHYHGARYCDVRYCDDHYYDDHYYDDHYYDDRYRGGPLVAYHIPACCRDRYFYGSFFS